MMAGIFLTYLALLWLVFDKLKLIRLSLPLAVLLAAVGPVFAAYVLLSMNNFHPSSSDARVFQRIIPLVANITKPGRVKEIVALPNTPVKAGDVLFVVDPAPFQFDVTRLEAALAAATQSVPQLKSSLDQATAAVARINVQLDLATTEYERQRQLFEKKVVAQAVLDRAQRNVDTARQAVAEASAAEERARLAFQSNVDGDNTDVAQVRQQLEQAQYNLAETAVRAPCDGFITNLQLVPGTIVSSAASVAPFVCDRDDRNRGVVVASFMQSAYLQISPGDYAEVVFPMYPGRVLTGKVLTTIDAAGEGQIKATGLLPDVDRPAPTRFAVRILLDNAGDLRLPAGAQGSAAIYTGNVQIAGIIRMAIMRFGSWTNYIFFTT